jgi:thioesterase domain-containing protein
MPDVLPNTFADAASAGLVRCEFGKAYLQRRIADFPLARHIGIEVDSVDDGHLVLIAPLAANANDKGTAFGGSLFSVAVLTGWAWVARHLACNEVSANAVIQQGTMRYLLPVPGRLHASLVAPAAPQVEKFGKMLQRAGCGRIRLEVHIRHEGKLATIFEGLYAATMDGHRSMTARPSKLEIT